MNVIELNRENFENEVLKSQTPVLVDFWAPDCGYCRRLSPVIDKLAESYGENVKVAKLNIDIAENIGDKYEINTIPSLILFQNGQHGDTLVNPKSKGEIDRWVNEQILK